MEMMAPSLPLLLLDERGTCQLTLRNGGVGLVCGMFRRYTADTAVRHRQR